MKTSLIAIGGVLGIGALFVLVAIFGYVGFSNQANMFENNIPAQYQQMKNVYDNGWKQVMETASLSDKYADDFKSVYQAMLTGRYGADGSKAVLQFIKESNPTLDPGVYRKVQDQIENFHSSFQASQTKIISEKQEYANFLNATTDGRVYNFIGHYPHIHAGVPAGSADDYAILTSDKTETDFNLHKSDALTFTKHQN